MRLLVGLGLTALGILVAGLGLYPWVFVYMTPPRRYHYFYMPDETKWTTIAFMLTGALLIGLGLWTAFHRNRPKDHISN